MDTGGRVSWKVALLDAFISHFGASTPNLTHRAFYQHPIASLSFNTPQHICPAIYDEYTTRITQPSDTPALFILGAQKAGTTYLHSALVHHPNIVSAERSPAADVITVENLWLLKELHLFDRFPLRGNDSRGFTTYFPDRLQPGQVLIDSTPNYLYTPMAPPRIQALVPNAKFVVVLRDPVMREYSAFHMTVRNTCHAKRMENPNADCTHTPFYEMVAANMQFQLARKCLFTHAGSNNTWGSCFKCGFPGKLDGVCDDPHHTGRILPEPCTVPRFSSLNHGSFAAQISWWFAFFPPERFLFILSSELHDPDDNNRVRLLNRIKAHAGVGGPDFDASALQKTKGFAGTYSMAHLSVDDAKALLALRLMYRQSLADLTALLRGDGVHTDFPGIPEELSASEIQTHIDTLLARRDALSTQIS